MNEAAEAIYRVVDPDANLIFGAVIDPTMDKEVSITLIATGLQFGPAVSKPVVAKSAPPRYDQLRSGGGGGWRWDVPVRRNHPLGGARK